MSVIEFVYKIEIEGNKLIIRIDWKKLPENAQVAIASECKESQILERLAKDCSTKVRYGVATNPNTPVDVLEELGGDENNIVIKGVAMNPSTPAYVLDSLASHHVLPVRKGVALNPNTS